MTATADATFPQLLAGLARRQPGGVALREKRYGVWQPLTWAEHERRVRRFALGLAALGFQRGRCSPSWATTVRNG